MAGDGGAGFERYLRGKIRTWLLIGNIRKSPNSYFVCLFDFGGWRTLGLVLDIYFWYFNPQEKETAQKCYSSHVL